ncbi:MAG: endolytic transglycosylase MltG [Candidatus Azambacteria bacterium]|nr:endolytic transglycosylase MltG [Candidatus Azambacteria bacterium]
MNKKFVYVILIVLIAAFVSLFIFWRQIRMPLSSSGETVILKVEKGDSAEIIAKNLKSAGLIKSPFLFRLYVFLSLNQYALKTGDFELSPKMSIRDIGDILALGGVNEVLITIPEGFSLKQIEDRLVEAKLAKPNELDRSLEGYLFPDTYRFFSAQGGSASGGKDALSDIVTKMVNNLENKLTPDLQTAIKNSKYSFYEILTMASLIEKEISIEKDRSIVSGILWKRLKAGMPLQVDATLVYITGRNEIGDADKKINSRYNTYLYRGLPAGPIANPGLSAIKAALFPEASPYWYYLSAKDGTTIFSKTLEEHNRNRSIYLK